MDKAWLDTNCSSSLWYWLLRDIGISSKVQQGTSFPCCKFWLAFAAGTKNALLNRDLEEEVHVDLWSMDILPGLNRSLMQNCASWRSLFIWSNKLGLRYLLLYEKDHTVCGRGSKGRLYWPFTTMSFLLEMIYQRDKWIEEYALCRIWDKVVEFLKIVPVYGSC